MTPAEAAERLRRAEREYREAQQLDGSYAATERYRAASSELKIAERIARAMLYALLDPARIESGQ